MASLIDYIVIAVFLVVCMAIGIFHGCRGKKRQTPEYYLLGNRHLQLFPVAISFFVTYQSAISLMGVPAEIYIYGFMIAWVYVGFSASLLLSAFTIVPMIHPLGITSAFEYLELRFKSKSVRLLGTGFSMLQTTLYMGITLYAPALALETVAKIPLWASIVIAGGVSIIYTAIGGIKSVVWTDAFQCFIVFSGTIAALIKGFIELGSPSAFSKILEEGNRLQYYDFNIDPRIRHTTWGVIIGSFFTFLPNWCNQSSVQRISSLKTQFLAKSAFLISIPCVIVYGTLLCVLGLVLYAYYNVKDCDPLKMGYVNNANQLMPYFVFDVMQSYPGVPGVYISALFSGSLSTVSSGINSLAANTVEDLLKNHLIKFNKFQVTLVAKVAVLFYGGLAIGVAYAAQLVPGTVTQIAMAVFGAVGGPVAGLFFLGAMFPFANWIGAFCGGLLSIILNVWIAIGTTVYGKKPSKLEFNPTSGCYSSDHNVTTKTELNITSIATNYTTIDLGNTTMSDFRPQGSIPPFSDFFLYNISYIWYGFIGFVLTIILGIIISCVTGKVKNYKTEEEYLFPFCRRCFKGYISTKEVKTTTHHALIPEFKNFINKEKFVSLPDDNYT